MKESEINIEQLKGKISPCKEVLKTSFSRLQEKLR